MPHWWLAWLSRWTCRYSTLCLSSTLLSSVVYVVRRIIYGAKFPTTPICFFSNPSILFNFCERAYRWCLIDGLDRWTFCYYILLSFVHSPLIGYVLCVGYFEDGYRCRTASLNKLGQACWGTAINCTLILGLKESIPPVVAGLYRASDYWPCLSYLHDTPSSCYHIVMICMSLCMKWVSK